MAAMWEPLFNRAAVEIDFAHLPFRWDNEAFDKALAFLAERNVDVVVISGDVTEFGTPDELQMVLDAWNKAFPDGKAADGRRTEKFIVWGNHDYSDASYMRRMPPERLVEQIKVSVVGDKDAAWRRIGEGAFPKGIEVGREG